MPGIGEEIDGAVQHAPQPARHSMASIYTRLRAVMLARILWTSAGTIFLALGIAGVVLPLMPGTVFLLLASICYLRGSQRLHRWLVNHPVLGHHVKVMLGEAPMSTRSKVTAITAMWIAVAISLFATRSVIVQIVFVALALFGTWFIAVRRRASAPAPPASPGSDSTRSHP